MDRLDALHAFVVTAERGSLSAAARELGRSPASVTRAVASLEERAGTVLLRRTTRSLKLTEAGERYLGVARRVLADLAEADRSASATRSVPQGLLTVTAPLSFGAKHVGPLIDSYLGSHPEVRARLLLLDRVVNLMDEGIDVAVRIAHLPDSALVAIPVGAVRRVLVASPTYIERYGRPSDPSELAAHRCISFAAVTPSDTWVFGSRREERSKSVKVRPVLVVNGAEAAVGAATNGTGLACVLSYQAADALRAGTLLEVLPTFGAAPLPVHLVYAATGSTTAKVRAFLDLAAPALRSILATTEPRARQGSPAARSVRRS